MRAGALRHYVEIQVDTPTTNNYNEKLSCWGTAADGKCWAEVLPLSGKALERARQLHASISHQIRIRYSGDITTRNRVKYGDRIFNIESVINTEERNKELVLMCSEGVV